jgi:hypothetical protein
VWKVPPHLAQSGSRMRNRVNAMINSLTFYFLTITATRPCQWKIVWQRQGLGFLLGKWLKNDCRGAKCGGYLCRRSMTQKQSSFSKNPESAQTQRAPSVDVDGEGARNSLLRHTACALRALPTPLCYSYSVIYIPVLYIYCVYTYNILWWHYGTC